MSRPPLEGLMPLNAAGVHSASLCLSSRTNCIHGVLKVVNELAKGTPGVHTSLIPIWPRGARSLYPVIGLLIEILEMVDDVANFGQTLHLDLLKSSLHNAVHGRGPATCGAKGLLDGGAALRVIPVPAWVYLELLQSIQCSGDLCCSCGVLSCGRHRRWGHRARNKQRWRPQQHCSCGLTAATRHECGLTRPLALDLAAQARDGRHHCEAAEAQ
mmetsp:Transcript_106326/g.295845  ORF Transcript_106326/g.295845 Transcript_106326/m.295845 type:complete len:214 (+) Transcript_106326:86-727(+)